MPLLITDNFAPSNIHITD